MNDRERLGSRLGFIMLSAGCAIGCGNVWKFPWMCGQYGGGSFMLVYLICLLLLGLPVLVMEFAIGRAAQASPVKMYRKLEKPGGKWGIWGGFCLVGNVALMAFYCVVAGWILYYFCRFAAGNIGAGTATLADTAGSAAAVGSAAAAAGSAGAVAAAGFTGQLGFSAMIANPYINVAFLFITVLVAFALLSFDLQKGPERVTKVMMCGLLVLLIVLAVRSVILPGAGEGLRFYLIPDFSAITGEIIVKAMNQAFFTLSVGMGGMAIFGSYIEKERSLMGEAILVIILDTFVAVIAGLIIFPACFSYGLEVTSGPSLLFDTMAAVFLNMPGGRWWGALFFLFMVFAAMSTVLGVCENILAMVRELTGWSRRKGAAVCGIIIFCLALTTALGFSVFHFHPFGEETTWLDFWDFVVSTNILPLGSLVLALFCCNRFGWGWEAFLAEANEGGGLKVKQCMKPLFRFFVPVVVLFIYIYGMATFSWT